ncbi:MAG: DUF2490 domain-containing protein [Pseudomonadota bacterium]
MSALVLLSAGSATATVNNPGAWAVFSGSGSFRPADKDNRWRYWIDAQHRYFDIGSGITQSVLRPAVGMRFDNGVTVLVGYGYFNNRRTDGERFEEHRPWQQVGWTALKRDRSSLGVRLRLEQRFLDIGDDVGWTLRTQLSYTRRLGNANRWQAIAFLEPFFDLNDTDWGGEARLSQNRVFLGAGYRMTNTLSLEFGYMHQYFARPGENLGNHLGILHLKFRR